MTSTGNPIYTINMNKIVDFLFEIGYLRKIKRSSLKNNPSNIAEHSFRVAMIALVLGKKIKANQEKVLIMSLTHDIAESRTRDQDLVSRAYNISQENKALNDQLEGLPIASDIKSLHQEFVKGLTKESQAARDADILDELLTEKEQLDRGELRAKGWMEFSFKHLKTSYGKKLGQAIMQGYSDHWWHEIVRKNSKKP